MSLPAFFIYVLMWSVCVIGLVVLQDADMAARFAVSRPYLQWAFAGVLIALLLSFALRLGWDAAGGRDRR